MKDGINPRTPGSHAQLQQWIRARLEENLPYDQFVERILTATSREERSLDEWGKESHRGQRRLCDAARRYATSMQQAQDARPLLAAGARRAACRGRCRSPHSFLGLRLECAQCHRHPHDVWQQDDLLSFANFFMHVRQPGFQGDNEKKFSRGRRVSLKNLERRGEEARRPGRSRCGDTVGKKLDAVAKASKRAGGPGCTQEVPEGRSATLERRSKALPRVWPGV